MDARRRRMLRAASCALAAALVAWPVSLLGLGDLPTILLQGVAMLVAYVGLSALFRVEEFFYLLDTLRELRMGRAG